MFEVPEEGGQITTGDHDVDLHMVTPEIKFRAVRLSEMMCRTYNGGIKRLLWRADAEHYQMLSRGAMGRGIRGA
jgi:hypothetical protein